MAPDSLLGTTTIGWEIAHGYKVMCFDITADHSAAGSSYTDEDHYGTLRLCLDYEKPLAEAITIFCLTEEMRN